MGVLREGGGADDARVFSESGKANFNGFFLHGPDVLFKEVFNAEPEYLGRHQSPDYRRYEYLDYQAARLTGRSEKRHCQQ